MKVERRENQEVNLRDFFSLIVSYKRFMGLVIFLCVGVAVLFSLLMPKKYEIFEVLKPPLINTKAEDNIGLIHHYLDSPYSIKEKVKAGVYNAKIRASLGLPPQHVLNFSVTTPKEGGFLAICMLVREDEVDINLKVLEELYSQIQKEYAPVINTNKKMFDNIVDLKLNEIDRKKAKIQTLLTNVRLIEERTQEISEEFKLTQDNTQKLVYERNALLEENQNQQKGDSTSILYTTTIQQLIIYYIQLGDQLNSLKTARENIFLEIDDLTKRIDAIKIEIGELKNRREYVSNVIQMQPPLRSVSHVIPNIKLNIIIAFFLGAVLGSIIICFRAFAKQYS